MARCVAVLRNGRRCPNAAEAGTRYCAIPAHSQLVGLEGALGRELTSEEVHEAVTPKGYARISGLAEAGDPATTPGEGS
jgi:transcription termination/antitermination protein NusA